MTQRQPREGEVRVFRSRCGRVCVGVIKRPDGLFWFYEDWIIRDDDCDVYYWSMPINTNSGLYGTVDEAEADIRSRPEYRDLT